ncbi:dihydrolipoyl dehydrogenase [Halobacteriovorax sp.]|uniref:dihydrolipoyl dehydrogenase n=1 Tax=Halobacteriovorax sp. TaxID=2020862 RepID=UPI003569BF62
MKSFDVLILGAGSAGLTAFGKLRHSLNVGIINAGSYGTTCARVGCMPSKVLIQVAEDYHRAKILKDKNLVTSDIGSINTQEVMSYMRSMRDKFVSGTNRALLNIGDSKIDGTAIFVDKNTVKVNDVLYKAKSFIISVGSKPFVPEAWKAFGDLVITSDEVFELEKIPLKLAVIGLGPIGLELGQAFHRLGSKVTAFDLSNTIAGITDPSVAKEAIEQIGNEFTIHLGSGVELKKNNTGIEVSNGAESVIVDKVLVSMGRRSNVPSTMIKSINIQCDKDGLPLNINPLNLNIPETNIYIAGDANGIRPILHEASDEGRMVAESILNGKPISFKRKTPMGICFTSPQVISVGQKWLEVKDNLNIVVAEDHFTMGRSKVIGEKGLMKVYGEKTTGKILGAEMVGPQVEHLAHYLALAIEKGTTISELLQMPIYHPTIEESLRSTLRSLAKNMGGKQVSEICCLNSKEN